MEGDVQHGRDGCKNTRLGDELQVTHGDSAKRSQPQDAEQMGAKTGWWPVPICAGSMGDAGTGSLAGDNGDNGGVFVSRGGARWTRVLHDRQVGEGKDEMLSLTPNTQQQINPGAFQHPPLPHPSHAIHT